jgi:hypothetical protein
VSFAAITLCVASQRVLIVVIVIYFVITQSGNFWIHPRRYPKQSLLFMFRKFVFIYHLFHDYNKRESVTGV